MKFLKINWLSRFAGASFLRVRDVCFVLVLGFLMVNKQLMERKKDSFVFLETDEHFSSTL